MWELTAKDIVTGETETTDKYESNDTAEETFEDNLALIHSLLSSARWGYTLELKSDVSPLLNKKLTVFLCSVCGQHIEVDTLNSITTGYGCNDKHEPVCFACCAETDRKYMQEHGRISLYLIGTMSSKGVSHRVCNWPDSLSYPVLHHTTGRHNIAGTRYDVWFKDEVGAYWHGTRYGQNTDVVHCKRVKKLW